MNIQRIKDALEKEYLVGFVIEGDNKNFTITLAGSEQDKFRIKGEIKDDIRLNLEIEPEKYGANFLRLINYSDISKRKGCVSLIDSIPRGETSIYVNQSKTNVESFIEDKTSWENFKIKYTLIPYYDDDDSKTIETIVSLCGMILALIDYSIEGYEEGNSREVHSNKYERNPVNRRICLAKKGYKCSVCGFDFELQYGDIGKEVIEVHHTKQVSQMGANYVVDPLKELEPVCSNCHTIIHKRKEPYTIEEVKRMISREYYKGLE